MQGAADADAELVAEPEGAAGTERRVHRRGLSSCIFVPLEQAHTCILNMPSHQMDFFMTG